MADHNYDWFATSATATTYAPTRDGGSTTNLANGSAPLGSRVHLHIIKRIGSGATTTLDIKNGDASATYFTVDTAAATPASSGTWDIVLTNGLTVTQTNAGAYFVAYRVLSNI